MFLVGGHRGCGENLLRRRHALHEKPVTGIRENTIASFVEAASLGAHFVEFDVQVTADGVAVIFHDDYLVHGNAWAAQRSLVRQLTAEQFSQLGSVGAGPTSLMRWFRCSETREALRWDAQWECDTEDVMPTLEQVFDCVPAHIGFNIEIKMATSPVLQSTPREELDRMLDAILPVVRSRQGNRPVMLSSFDPDMMAELARRSSDLLGPTSLWFLTTGGHNWHADARRQSVAAAIDVAALHGLTGVVLESKALRDDVGAMQLALSKGLSVMTYGVSNGDAAWVQRQRILGVRGVIVDDVAAAVACIDSASSAKPLDCGIRRTISDVPEVVAAMTSVA